MLGLMAPSGVGEQSEESGMQRVHCDIVSRENRAGRRCSWENHLGRLSVDESAQVQKAAPPLLQAAVAPVACVHIRALPGSSVTHMALLVGILGNRQ